MTKKIPMSENTTTTANADPFADRESQNYENPVPSREFILSFLTDANIPMNRNDLFEALGLSGEAQYEGLRRRRQNRLCPCRLDRQSS